MIKKDKKKRNLNTGEDQEKNGRYRYRYTDKYGNRRCIYSWRLVPTDKTPPGKKDGPCLRELEREIARDIEDGINSYEAATTTVYQLISHYLNTKPQIANSTMQNYLHMLEKNIKPHTISQMKIADVKKSDIKNYYAYLYKERNFSASTLQLYQNIIYPAFQLAVDDDLIRKNPCKDCMKDYTGGCSTVKIPLTREQQNALLEYVHDSNFYRQYYVIIAFMLATGCRIGETIGVTWDDIDLENGKLSINHQVIYKKVLPENKTRHYVEKPKNRTSRTIPLQKDIIRLLSEYKNQTYFISKISGCEVDGYKNFVFLNSKHKLFIPDSFTRTLHSIRDTYNKSRDEDAGEVMLPDFSSHTFRHTFCTRMAENGMDVKVLQEIMGHKSINITMEVYNHVLSGRVEKEVERVSSALVV